MFRVFYLASTLLLVAADDGCPALNYNAQTTHVATDFKTYALVRCKDDHEMADKLITKELQCVDGVWSEPVPICFGPGRVVRRDTSNGEEAPPPTPDPNDGCKWKPWSDWANCTAVCPSLVGRQTRVRVTDGAVTDDECSDWQQKAPLIHTRSCEADNCITTTQLSSPSTTTSTTQFRQTNTRTTALDTTSTSASSTITSTLSPTTSTLPLTTQTPLQTTTSFWGPWITGRPYTTGSVKECRNITFDPRTQIITYNPPDMKVGTQAFIKCRENMYLTNGKEFDVLECLNGGRWDKVAPLPCTYERPTEPPIEGCKIEPCPTAGPPIPIGVTRPAVDDCDDPCPDPDPSCPRPVRGKCTKPCVPCQPNNCRIQCFEDCDRQGGDVRRCRDSCDQRCDDYCKNTFRKCVNDCRNNDRTCQRQCNEQYTERGCDPIDKECDSFRQYERDCDADTQCKDKWTIKQQNRGCDTVSSNCKLSPWSEWGSCSASCSGGCKYRLREVVQYGMGRGQMCECDELMQRQDCNIGVSCEPDCDCEWDQWSAWSGCSATCDTGSNTRSRVVLNEKQGRGKACPGADTETQSCYSGRACCTPRDCQWGSWTSWGACTVSCGSGGEITRHRQITSRENECGTPCDYTERLQRRECPQVECPVDCVYQWASWSHCSVTCGTGTRSRSAYVQREASRGGRRCPAMQTESCYTPENTAPIEYQSWGEWGACTATCDSGQSTAASQSRTRAATQCGRPVASPGSGINPLGIMTNIGGSIPSASSDTRACPNLAPCECEWSTWGYWGRCSATCGAGTQERSRYVLRQGAVCPGSGSEVQSCPDLKPCCDWREWGAWGACSVSCGSGGFRTRMRYGWPERACQQQFGAGGEKQEEHEDCRDIRKCVSDPIRDCRWSQWGAWDSCSEDCGVGTQARRRYVQVQASKMGQYCVGDYEEVRMCDTTLPPRECPPIAAAPPRYSTGRTSYSRRPVCKSYCKRSARRRRAICESHCKQMELFAPRYEQFVERMQDQPIQDHIRVQPKKGRKSGRNMKLVCDTDIPYDTQSHKEHIVWLHDGSFCNIHRRRKILKDGSLLIRGLRSRDSGNYTCAIASSHHENTQGIVAVSQPFSVKVKTDASRRVCLDKLPSCKDESTDDLCRKRHFRKQCCHSCKKIRRTLEKLMKLDEDEE